MDARLRVPRDSGSLLAVPPLTELADIAREAYVTRGPATAAGRDEVLSLALEQTRQMDGESPLAPAATVPWIVTGHQPDLYHPGIWVKNFIVGALCRRHGFSGLNLTVDADLPSSRGVELPVRHGGSWQRHPVVMSDIRLGRPWEAQPPLDSAGWDRFFNAVRGRLVEPLRPVFEAFVERVGGTPSVLAARTLADSLARARRAWEAGDGYLELDVSTLCGSDAFHGFVVSILARLEAFWQVHNDCLDAYRMRRRIRSAANPVPDLRRRDGLWETPFWCVHPDGERGGLFLERDGAAWKVESKDTTFGLLRLGDEAAWSGQLREMIAHGGAGLRPRALTLTMFIRRCLADLFVHGVGGARYERVGDAIVERFFATASGAYAVASATFTPKGLDDDVPEDRPATLRQRLRELTYNPQRFGGGAADVARKRALVSELASVQGAPKRALNDQLDALNAALASQLGTQRDDLAARLAAAERAQAIAAVTRWRGYPYFLFEPAQVRAAVDHALD